MIFPKATVSAIALLLASAGGASAFVATAVTDLNVRRGPGTNYGVVDVLQAGETVEVVNRAGGWYQLASGGWASGNYLDPEGGGAQAVIIDRGYDYGPVAFYYDDHPYYWDDAGFYFYIDGGRRHRVGWNWFRDRDHRHFRWSDRRHRDRFEDRWRRFARGDWDSDRRWRGGRDGDGDRRIRRGDEDRGFIRRGDDDGRRIRREEDGDRFSRRERVEELQTGRASVQGEARGGAEARGSGEVRRSGPSGGGEARMRGGGGSRGGGEGGQRRFEEGLPGGGY